MIPSLTLKEKYQYNMKISLIAAHGKNREIGLDNKLLWHISEDLKRFKRITSGHTVIMGRLTFESIGSKPLSGRRNIIMSRSLNRDYPGVEVVRSLNEALDRVQEEEEVFILGGAEIYRQFIPYADLLYLTIVDKSYKADSYFPEYSPEDWKITEHIDVKDDPQVGVNFSFVTLQRKK